jgi:hypothetical protein
MYSYEINSLASLIPGRYFGLFKVLTPAQRLAMLQAAADGDLQGYIQDDTPLSYVELVVRADQYPGGSDTVVLVARSSSRSCGDFVDRGFCLDQPAWTFAR